MATFGTPNGLLSLRKACGLDGRWWAAGVIVGYVVLLFFASSTFGKTRVLSAAGAIQMSEHFADLALFSAARQELDRGGNPYLRNPDDPWGRPFNYPTLWLAFMRFPMSWVPAVGCGLIFAWLVATGWWWGSLTKAQGLLAGAAICSPPVVLAMERGNCDQIVFLLAILALTALHRGFRIAAWAMIFFAFALKLFPAAGFVVFLRLGWRKASAWLAITAVLMTGYLFYKHDEMRTVLYNTPGDFLMSYGATHWTKLADHWVPVLTGERYAFHHLESQSSLWAALLFLGALWRGHSRRDRETEAGPDRYLDGFRLGACIYALTFIAGTNYFYRLVFLLLCLPWLWKSDSAGTRIGKMRWLGLTLIFSVLWINPYWWPPLALGSEASAWGLLCVTGWLLGATLPKWERRPNPHP